MTSPAGGQSWRGKRVSDMTDDEIRAMLVARPLPPCCWVTDHVPHPGDQCCRHGDTANCPDNHSEASHA